MVGRRDFTGLWCVAVFALALGWGYLRPASTHPATEPDTIVAAAGQWTDAGSNPAPEMRRLCQRMIMR